MSDSGETGRARTRCPALHLVRGHLRILQLPMYCAVRTQMRPVLGPASRPYVLPQSARFLRVAIEQRALAVGAAGSRVR